MIYLVSGSREFPDMQFVKDYIWHNLKPYDTLIHGTARGVDQACARMAKGCGSDVIGVPAQWDIYGKKAGAIRNGEMLESLLEHKRQGNTILALIFWDGVSKGTANFIYQADLKNVPYKLFNVKVKGES